MKKLLFFLLFSCFLFFTSSHLLAQACQDTLCDTLWAVPQLDGEIGYRPFSGTFGMNTGSVGLRVGDGYDPFMMENVFVRSYLSYDLTGFLSLDSTNIIKAVVGVYQFGSYGNEQPNVFPIWNVAGGDTHFCVLDHIDYGYSLDLNDWTAGDPGDPQTLHTKIGVISDSATIEYKTMDVTNFVREDIQNGKYYNQYRMRFTIDTDNDIYSDLLIMVSGNSTVYPRPYLLVKYEIIDSIIDPWKKLIAHKRPRCYPNPFNSQTTIEYSLQKSGWVNLEVYDNIGRKVRTLVNSKQLPGIHQILFDATGLSSGVYFYQLKTSTFSQSNKLLYVR